MLFNKIKLFFFVSFFFISACSNLKQHFVDQPNAFASANSEMGPAYPISEDFDLDPECFISADELFTSDNVPHKDVWDRVREGYKLPEYDNKRVQTQLKWYVRHPKYMMRVTKRSQPYMFHIVEQLEKRNMPLEIALLPIVESAFDPFAYSHGRASGMWQIVPGTGRMLGLKQNWWYDGRRDVVASTEAALKYLQKQHKRFDGDWLLALASYNSGAGNVSRAIKKNKKRGKPTDFWNLDLPKETKDYVPRLLALAKIFADPHAHNVTLHSVPNEQYFTAVKIGSQIDLAQAANLAEIDMNVLYHLNPGFNRWATDPTGPHELLMPAERAISFSEKLAKIPDEDRVTWERYKIRSGDSLSTIARRYKISVASLKTINKLPNNNIRAGRTLMVPVAAKPGKHYSYSFDERIAKRYAAVAKKQGGQKIDYTVKSGDSLWSISRRYKVSTAKLARWNSMAQRDPIKPGQVLKIWTKLPAVAGGSGVVRRLNYRVRSGDSLARIAKKFDLKIDDILQWNNIQRSKYLQPGQSLKLFVDVKRIQES
ncbi:lytic transglycosylase [Agarilytica rhodophyticola]|uniref:lytic transglycosylase n=1 Tax=Agarilytica rhodophyticola TaxID=1737490 RepID=UPI001FE83DE7|nr:LysM peptidoglycan-binding domain-containing protein [Agarilytica rhodophyticola]